MKHALDMTVDVTAFTSNDAPRLRALGITARANERLAGRAGEVARVQQGLVVFQLIDLQGDKQAAVGRALDIREGHVKHRRAIGAAILKHGIDPNGRNGDVITVLANTVRVSLAKYAPEKDYLIQTPADRFDIKHLRALIAKAGDGRLTADQREAKSLVQAMADLAAIAKAAREASNLEGDDDTEGEGSEGDATLPTTEDILGQIATLSTMIGNAVDLDRGLIVNALAKVAKSMMDNAPAVVDTAA